MGGQLLLLPLLHLPFLLLLVVEVAGGERKGVGLSLLNLEPLTLAPPSLQYRKKIVQFTKKMEREMVDIKCLISIQAAKVAHTV